MKKQTSTLFKFIFFYFLIYLALMMGFFYIIRYQFSEYYYDELRHQTEIQIDNLGNQLNEEFLYLSQLSTILQKNSDLMLYGYSQHDISEYQVMTELEKYDDASGIIRSIVWKNKNSDTVLSTTLPVKFGGNAYRIYYDTENYISIDASGLFENRSGKVICIAQKGHNYLIYVPDIEESRKNQFFFVLEDYYLLKTLNNLTSSNIPVIGILEADGNIVLTSNAKAVIPSMEEVSESGFYKIDADNSCYIKADIMGELSLVALISREALIEQINQTLAKSYLIFVGIGIVGLVFIILGMRTTYMPLYKLVKKVGSEEKVSQREHFSYLEEHFSQMNKHNEQLNLKLDKYRSVIKKSLLDSVVQSSGVDVDFSDIDVFFENEQNSNLYAVSLTFRDVAVSVPKVLEYFKTALGENVFCLVLESGKNELVLLLNDIGTQGEKSKREKLQVLLDDLHDKFQYVSVISESSRSILDIPMLYKEVKNMSERQGKKSAQEGDASEEAFLPVYPYEEIASLSEIMWDGDFDKARSLIQEILLDLEETVAINNDAIKCFYVQCVLLDVLTAIENVMNQQNINFNTYSDEYYAILYQCRSCSYMDERDKIAENLEVLLKICERKLKRISCEDVKEFIDETAYDPNFSIYVMADHFQLGVSQMSELVKKEMGVTFSEYLWSVRLQKSQELLLHSDSSIEDISSQVGYLNVSSFRRRFKENMGITPLKYRELYGK